MPSPTPSPRPSPGGRSPAEGPTFGNSLALTLAYDNDDRVTAIGAAGSGTTAQDLSYGSAAASNTISTDGVDLTAARADGYKGN